MFKYSNSNKRYHTLDYYYKKKYGKKVFKVSLDIGCTCPNIDGLKGHGGCIYCLNGSSAFGENSTISLKEQFKNVKNIMLKKWPDAYYIAYFQAGSNTYGDFNYLKKCYEEALCFDGVVGINIATRCDAISCEMFDYLVDLNKRTNLVVELGLQTIKEETSKLINRGHSLDEFNSMFKKLKDANINVVVHIINGLPFETKDDMINTVKYLNNLHIFGIKIHMLHILKNTVLEKLYYQTGFHVLTKNEYVDIVCDQLEHLCDTVVINRITGDPIIDDLIEPTWLIKKFGVLNDIDKELVKRNSFQGKKA